MDREALRMLVTRLNRDHQLAVTSLAYAKRSPATLARVDLLTRQITALQSILKG